MKKVIVVAALVLVVVMHGIPAFAGEDEGLKQQKELLRELQRQNQLLRQQLQQQQQQPQPQPVQVRPAYNPYLVPSGAMVRGDLPAYAGGRGCGVWYGSGEYYPSIFTSEKVRVVEYPDGSRVIERSPDLPTKVLRAGTIVGLGALLR